MSEKTTLEGSCKCGYVKYKVNVKLEADGGIKANRCNCTFCTKLGTTNSMLESADDFVLIEPESIEKLGAFAPRVKTLPRYFCQQCGSHITSFGYYELPTGRRDMASFNVATIDQPQGKFDLKKTHIEYYNGLPGRQFIDGTRPEPFENGLL